MPVGEAPHREIEADPGAEARLEMVELAIADDARFELSRIELDREGPSYTADTLRALREAEPDDELFLILGGDQAAALAVLARARGGARAGRRWRWWSGSSWSRNAIAHQGRPPAGRGADPLPRHAASSRSRPARSAAGAARGQPIRYLVPDKVASYIGANEPLRPAPRWWPRERHEHRAPPRSPSASRRSRPTARRSTSAWSTCAGSSPTPTSS